MLKIFKRTILSFSLFMSTLCMAQENAEDESPLISICSPTECYLIERELGQGALGKVYAVRDSNGRQLALKSYRKYDDLDGAWQLLGDSKREFELGQVLNHPNIIKSYDWFFDENETFYVLLEYVEGKTVFSTSRKSITKEQAIHLSLQLVDALKYSYENEYLFLDLHTGNIMVSDYIETKVVDISSFFSFEEIMDLFAKQKGLKKKGIHDDGNSIREEKFKKFMAQNKHLFNGKKVPKNISMDWVLKQFVKSNFEGIIEMTVTLISKTDLSREEKIELYSKIKRISYNCLEDSLDGIEQPMPYYLDQLENGLKSEIK